MKNKVIDTEAQQILIAGLRDHVAEVFSTLQSSKEKLEAGGESDQTKEKIFVLKLRLDALAKIDVCLLKTTQELYETLENGSLQPGDLPKLRASIADSLLGAMMQGVE